MNFEKTLKDIAWTEAEVIAVGAGMIVSSKFLNDKKLFKKHYDQNPDFFEGSRHGAPFMIKWSGAIKAGGAIFASTHIKNPWAKLFLLGVALQGTVQQAKVLTFDEKTGKSRIGAGEGSTDSEALKKLDDALKGYAMDFREQINGTQYINGTVDNYTERYTSQVAGTQFINGTVDNYTERYTSQVAGSPEVYDEDSIGFNFHDDNDSWVQ